MGNDLQNTAREISDRLRSLEAEYITVCRGAFSTLEKLDPDTAKMAIEAVGNRANASLWFGDRVGSLCEQTPWEVLAAGELSRVHCVLNAIVCGLPA